MPSVRLSRLLLLSAALHIAGLLWVGAPVMVSDWQAGPISIRLVQEAANLRRNNTSNPAKAALTDAKQQYTETHRAHPAVHPAQRPRISRIAGSRPAAATTRHDTTPVTADTGEERSIPDTAGLEQLLRDRLHKALLPHFSYPLLARRRGWEGIVRVGVRIEVNGSLTHLRLVEPCPYDILNNAAIRSLAQLARLPDAGTWLHGGPVDLVLPVEYHLLEG